jgi:hypothetical protein
MDPDVAMLERRRGWRHVLGAAELGAHLRLHRFEEARQAPVVEHVFQPRLQAVGPVAAGEEHAQDRVAHLHDVAGRDDDVRAAGEVAVAGDAAEAEAEQRLLADLHRGEGDVVGVLQDHHAPAAVEGDVELPRQAEQVAGVQDVVVQRADDRPGVDQLVRVDARGRVAGDIADVVRAGPLRDDAQVAEAVDHLRPLVGRDHADL